MEPDLGHPGSVWPQVPFLKSLHTRGGVERQVVCRLSALLKWSWPQPQLWLWSHSWGTELPICWSPPSFAGFSPQPTEGSSPPLSSEVQPQLVPKLFKWFQEQRLLAKCCSSKQLWLLLSETKMMSSEGYQTGGGARI